MDARPQITAKVVLLGSELWSIETILQNTLSITLVEREEPDMLLWYSNCLNRSWEDDREEFIREGLDMLIVLAKRWPELLMDNDLYKCLMVIVGKENIESETLTKAIDLMLVFAKKGESSRDDLAVRLDQLSALFFHQIKVFKDVIEEEPESYHIGREGLVSVASV
ncbi:hypothetical protein Tco_1192006 [Tanacetum coccineum]